MTRRQARGDEDPHVTAVRRLEAVGRRMRRFLKACTTGRAVRSGARHRRALHAPGRGRRARAGRTERRRSSRRRRRARRSATTRRCSIAMLRDPSTRALYLFPTKALAQDQLAELHQMAELVQATTGRTSACSPTTATRRRTRGARFRAKANVVLSNPDMLHSGILPHHPRWAKLFENLRFVVIDELHAYRGVFGSHLANILRRLARVCRHYGSSPAFICSSATIANPRELAERLVGRAVRAGRSQRRAARREVLSLRQSAGREPRARHPAVVSGRDAARRAGVSEARSADHRVRAEPSLHGNSDDVSEGRFPGAAGRRRRDSRLPRRLSAASPARDRARASGAATCGASSRRARSSWASTSARSMSR